VRFINNRYKLLVVDIDGTLVGIDGVISRENREALAKVRDTGIQVSLSTGRSVQSCTGILNQLSLDGYHIFCDGALAFNPDNSAEIYSQPLDKTLVKQAVEFANLHDVDLELHTATHYFSRRETWSTQAHREFFGVEANIGDFHRIWEREKIIKGGMVSRNPEEEAKARRFHLEFDGALIFSWVTTPAYPDVYFINVIAPGVSKGRALEALASYLKVDLGEVMAVGDGANDIPSLSVAGLAVAMGNAPEEVKAVADYTTLDVASNGLAAAISRFLL